MYAWRYYDKTEHGWWWWTSSSHVSANKAKRCIYTDPLGKHSRKRAKAAALAAKPSGLCVLVAVRRRVRE